MPIMITMPDDCKSLAEAVERLVACTARATHRATGGCAPQIFIATTRTWLVFRLNGPARKHSQNTVPDLPV